MDKLEQLKLVISQADNARENKDFEKAMELYSRALDIEPQHYRSLKALVILNIDHGTADKACIYAKRLSEVEPLNANDLNLIAVAFQLINNFDRAIFFYDKCVHLDPNNLNAIYNRGLLFRQIGNNRDALKDLTSFLLNNPDDFDAKKERAIASFFLKDFVQARSDIEDLLLSKRDERFLLNLLGAIEIEEKNYSKAVKIFTSLILRFPDFADAYFNLANCYFFENNFHLARLNYDRVLQIQPRHCETFIKLALIEKNEGNLDKAISILNKCIDFEPHNIVALSNLGSFYHDLDKNLEADECLSRALMIDPSHFDTLINRGKLLFDLSNFDASLEHFDKAIEINPRSYIGFLNRGVVKKRLGDLDAALSDYKIASELNPENKTALWNASMCSLLVGDYYSGWEQYEYRFDVKDFMRTGFPYPLPNSFEFNRHLKREEILGKSIILYSEQGIGDEIMFASILPDLLVDARKVYMKADPRLIKLFRNSFPQIEFIDRYSMNNFSKGEIDFHVAIGSLGFIYRRDAASFSRAPYLKPNTESVARWNSILPKEKKLVGLSWRGGVKTTNLIGRSASLLDFLPFFSRQDIQYVSLQYGDVKKEVEAFNSIAQHKLISFNASETNDIDDLAALIEAMDFVVTVQNSNVHLCGALGKPCIALLPEVPEWRYGRSGKKLDWYSSVNLFRRTPNTTWRELVSLVAAEID